MVAVGVRRSQVTEERLQRAGFSEIRCWLQNRPAYPDDVAPFVRTSILAAHLERLPEERHEEFVTAVVAGVRLPLDYVRLNVSALRGPYVEARLPRVAGRPDTGTVVGWGM